MKNLLWRLVCWLWVFAPLFGWWGKLHPIHAQYGWWVIASVAVLALAWLKPPVRKRSVISWFLTACLVAYLPHFNSFGMGLGWMIRSALVLSAAIAIAERTGWRDLYDALKVAFLIQLGVVLLKLFGVEVPWMQAGPGLAGTLYRRAGLSMLAAFVCIWSRKWLSYLAGAVSVLSGSLAGAVPAGLYLVSRLKSRMARWSLLGLGVMAAVLASGIRFQSRVESLAGLEFLRRGWLTGWGFFPMPGGFQEDTGNAFAVASVQLRNYHSVWADWLGRFGVIGLLAVLPVIAWIVKETLRDRADWKIWTLILALLAGSVQSAEGLAVMSLLGLIWWIRLEEESHVVAV